MGLVIEHFRFGPLMMECDGQGFSNLLHKRVVRERSGSYRDITICSKCLKEVISDEKVPGSYSTAKPHVSGVMLTVRPEFVYYPVERSVNLVFPVNLSKPIPDSARAAVSKLISLGRRVAN